MAWRESPSACSVRRLIDSLSEKSYIHGLNTAVPPGLGVRGNPCRMDHGALFELWCSDFRGGV